MTKALHYPKFMTGAKIRSDIVQVFVFKRAKCNDSAYPHDVPGVHFLQLLRRQDDYVKQPTWQPIMGHMREDETAKDCALREVAEEIKITGDKFLGFWQLEQPDIYFLQAQNSIMLSPCFAIEVDDKQVVSLNAEHTQYRWIPGDRVDSTFLWPGQRNAIKQIARDIIAQDSPVEPLLRISLLTD